MEAKVSEVAVVNQQGQKLRMIRLDPQIFERVEIKPELIHEVAVAMLANRRRPYADTKTRAQVRGGGKKPWRQKGTGRARAGSIRSPLWRGGGVTFGPSRERNFAKKVNRKTKRLALLMVLSDRVRENRLAVIEDWQEPSGKTSQLRQRLDSLLAKTGARRSKKVLIITAKPEPKLNRAASNLPEVKINKAGELKLLELLWAEQVLVFKEALPVMEKTYGTSG